MITTINATVAAVNLLFVRERNQHLWEMLFAYLAEPRDIWVALRPFFGGIPCWSRWCSSSWRASSRSPPATSAAWAATATTCGARGTFPRSPWALLALFALTMAQPITVKQVGGRPKTEVAWIASRHQMALDDYVLNQAVVNPALGPDPRVPAGGDGGAGVRRTGSRPWTRSRSPSGCSASPRAIGRIRSCARCAARPASGSGTWS